jgi:SPOR domain
VTEVATPEPAVQRGCPRCGAPLADDQEWCLACGTAVATRVAPTPRWRAPVALVGALIVLLGASLALALVELSRDPQPVAKAPPATPAPTAAATPAPTPTTTPAATPTATPTPTKGGSDQTPEAAPGAGVAPSSGTKLADWPTGRTAWTVVLASEPSRAAANRSARRLAAGAKGAPVGVLDPNKYPSLGPSAWTVFAGQFNSRALAAKAAQELGAAAYARRVVPG